MSTPHKAARAELELTDTNHLALQESLLTAKDAATEAEIEVGRLNNLFRVERLLVQERIASMNQEVAA
ncbi:MAG: hypothetical protein F6K00_19375 [Leptolyngbya sp. SIOISBB]|nr:hypothetical protein [Leptolyngbya sp. SIOISBB]